MRGRIEKIEDRERNVGRGRKERSERKGARFCRYVITTSGHSTIVANGISKISDKIRGSREKERGKKTWFVAIIPGRCSRVFHLSVQNIVPKGYFWMVLFFLTLLTQGEPPLLVSWRFATEFLWPPLCLNILSGIDPPVCACVSWTLLRDRNIIGEILRVANDELLVLINFLL